MSSYESDSDAPDDVAFSTTKEHVLREFEITKHERQRQDNSKEWRKTRDAMYKEQKKNKVLSMSVLAKAEDELNEKDMLARKRKRYEEEDEDEDEDIAGFSDVESSDGERDDAVKEGSDSEENEYSLENDEEIPRLSIQVLDKTEQKSMLQTALDFKSNALYGKSIQRVSVAKYKQQRKKVKSREKMSPNMKKLLSVPNSFPNLLKCAVTGKRKDKAINTVPTSIAEIKKAKACMIGR